MRLLVPILCLALLVTAAAAQEDDLPSPTPVPFTAEPRQAQWRLGFDLGNIEILETPELNPENDFKAAVREAERILPHPLLSFGLALLPYMKVNTRSQQLVNPRQWTLLNLQNRTRQRTFQGIGVFMGDRMTTTEGGYHLVSTLAMPRDPFVGLRKEPSPDDLIVGFAGNPKGKLQLRTKLSETKWENLLPVEDPSGLPAGYEAAKELLDPHDPGGSERFLYGTSIEASIRNRIGKLWILNYSQPDTTKGSHPWGVFLEEPGGLQPLYVFKPAAGETQYVAYAIATVDLNGDGTDELIVEASYRIGTAYKVISSVGGKYQEIHTSYYRGPAS